MSLIGGVFICVSALLVSCVCVFLQCNHFQTCFFLIPDLLPPQKRTRKTVYLALLFSACVGKKNTSNFLTKTDDLLKFHDH